MMSASEKFGIAIGQAITLAPNEEVRAALKAERDKAAATFAAEQASDV